MRLAMSDTPTDNISRSSGIFITGTDTNVGKTVVTASLGMALQRKGIHLGVMKPVETGVGPSEEESQADGSRLRHLLSPHHPKHLVTPYSFHDPLAPLAASRRAHQPMDLALIKERYRELSKNSDFLLVEGAGGVMVPLTEQQSMRDLISFLELPCIVVSRPTLGGVNHTLLTIQALRGIGIPIIAIVLNPTQSSQSSEKEQLQIDSTVQLIRELSGIPVVGPLPFEPLIETHWEEGVSKLAEDSTIIQLTELVMKTA